MLRHLHISNFAIVPSLDLDVGAGFTAITGETGAGKSILVDALGLLLGDRSDAGWVRAGAERAELTAAFTVEGNPEARKWLDDNELAADDACLLRRTINRNGRSGAFINGTPVTVAQVQSLGQLLVELHGQNEHLRLTKTAEQFSLLDGSGDYAGELAEVRQCFADWQGLATELAALEQESAVPAAELEFLNYQLTELQQHDLRPESVLALQADHDRLAAGGALLEALTLAIGLLDPESDGEGVGVNADLHACLSQLQKFVPLDKSIGEACQMLREAAVNCAEATGALNKARERLDLDPARFEQVSGRLSQLHDLARKHRVPMDGLQRAMETLAARVARAADSEKHLAELQRALRVQLDKYRAATHRLHLKRSRHALELSGRVAGLMAELGMVGGTFELAVSYKPQAAPSPRGDDTLQINISANPGMPPGPLNRIASGGELSRISLAIKAAVAGGGAAVTQVFDEVDAGIGGDTANVVGRMLRRLTTSRAAGNGQALCVTHLAQVAVCAAHHLLVRKSARGDSTTVDTRLLGRAEREEEIARMLSGKITAQSRAHAAELLEAAGTAG